MLFHKLVRSQNSKYSCCLLFFWLDIHTHFLSIIWIFFFSSWFSIDCQMCCACLFCHIFAFYGKQLGFKKEKDYSARITKYKLLMRFVSFFNAVFFDNTDHCDRQTMSNWNKHQFDALKILSIWSLCIFVSCFDWSFDIVRFSRLCILHTFVNYVENSASSFLCLYLFFLECIYHCVKKNPYLNLACLFHFNR